MNSSRQPGVSRINTAISCCYMMVGVRISKYLNLHTFSIISAKPDLMADTLLVLALPSFWSPAQFPISMLSCSPNCLLHSWASQVLEKLFTPRLLMNAPNASWLTCAIHGMWFHNPGHRILEAWSIDCSSQVIEEFDEALSVAIPSKPPSESLNQ